MSRVAILFFVLAQVFCVSAKELTSFVLTDSLEEEWVEKEFTYIFIDTSETLGLDEVRKREFEKVEEPHLKNRFQHAVYWMRILVVDKRTHDAPLRIELYDFDIDEISFFQQNPIGKYREYKAGYDLDFGHRQINHKNVSFHIYPVYQDSAFIYLRFKSHKLNVLKPVVRSYSQVLNYGLTEYLLLGVFYGLMLLMIFYNITYYFFLRSRNSVFYVLYAMAVLFYLMSENGTGFQYLWSSFPSVNDYISMLMLLTAEVFLLLFTRSYLEIGKHHLGLKRVMTYLVVFRLLLAVFQVYFKTTQAWELIDVLYVQVILWVGFQVYKKGFSSAKWFVIAFCALDVAFLIAYGERMGVLDSNAFTVYALYVGVVFQFVFLSIAIAEGVKDVFVRKNVIQAQLIDQYKVNESLSEKVNKELEEKVRERTQQLEKAKDELKAQAEEITKMNFILDNNNRQLSKDISTVVKESTKRGHFTFSEFMKAYPDNLTCKKFIYEIKEKEGFSCKKCAAQKKMDKGKKTYDRRCASCDYNESITANTLFHGSRYPLFKSFYMLYYFLHVEKGTMSIQELAQMLDINYNSVLLFKKKIDTRIERIKKKNPKQSVTLETVILNVKQ